MLKKKTATDNAEKKQKSKVEPEVSKEGYEEVKNQLVRALADYDNLRKRVEKEKEVWMRVAAEMFVAKLLPVLDTLELAQTHLNDQGLGIAINQFKDVLKEEGLEEIRPQKGDEFKSETDEAVESVAFDDESNKGKVADLVLAGWRFREGTVVRFAKVKVYGEEKPEVNGQQSDVEENDAKI